MWRLAFRLARRAVSALIGLARAISRDLGSVGRDLARAIQLRVAVQGRGFEELAAYIRREHPAAIRRAAQRAVSRTAREIRTSATDRIRDDTGAPRNRIFRAIRITQSPQKLTAWVSATRARIPLEHLKPKPVQTAAGVEYEIGGRRVVAQSAFIWRAKQLVFRRKGRPRLPIERVPGPSVSDLFSERVSELQREAEERLKRNLDRELKVELDRLMRKNRVFHTKININIGR